MHMLIDENTGGGWIPNTFVEIRGKLDYDLFFQLARYRRGLSGSVRTLSYYFRVIKLKVHVFLLRH